METFVQTKNQARMPRGRRALAAAGCAALLVATVSACGSEIETDVLTTVIYHEYEEPYWAGKVGVAERFILGLEQCEPDQDHPSVEECTHFDYDVTKFEYETLKDGDVIVFSQAEYSDLQFSAEG